eukprot:6454494-Amphidinium_carterae.1
MHFRRAALFQAACAEANLSPCDEATLLLTNIFDSVRRSVVAGFLFCAVPGVSQEKLLSCGLGPPEPHPKQWTTKKL